MTLITNTRSQRSRQPLRASTGVGGFSEMPAAAPSRANLAQQRPRIGDRLDVDRQQVGARLAEPLARNGAGSEIIRCTSSGRSVERRTASTTGSPKLRLGTKWPSMMSRCSSFAPALFDAANLLAQFGEVAGQQRRRDQRCGGVQIGKNPRSGHTGSVENLGGNPTRGRLDRMSRCQEPRRTSAIPPLRFTSISTSLYQQRAVSSALAFAA